MELTSNVHTMGGRAEMADIPPMPLWIAIIRIFQAVIAIIVLGLAAYADNVLSPYEGSVEFAYIDSGFSLAGCRMTFFTFSWTLLYLVYIGVTSAFLNAFYNMWAHMGLEILTCLWWLVSFALADGITAAAGLGALEWLLFVITLVMFGLALYQHRITHGMATAPAATNGAAMTEEHKMNTMNTAQPVPVHDPRYPQQYQQQQYQQQMA